MVRVSKRVVEALKELGNGHNPKRRGNDSTAGSFPYKSFAHPLKLLCRKISLTLCRNSQPHERPLSRRFYTNQLVCAGPATSSSSAREAGSVLKRLASGAGGGGTGSRRGAAGGGGATAETVVPSDSAVGVTDSARAPDARRLARPNGGLTFLPEASESIGGPGGGGGGRSKKAD